MSHTPGPWKALGLLSPFGWLIKYDRKDGKESIAYIQAYDVETDDPEPYGKWDEESQANHDLVLAAPDLLAALKYVMSAHGEQLSDAFEQAQTAIKKAEGL
jgi:hypothetical protein